MSRLRAKSISAGICERSDSVNRFVAPGSRKRAKRTAVQQKKTTSCSIRQRLTTHLSLEPLSARQLRWLHRRMMRGCLGTTEIPWLWLPRTERGAAHRNLASLRQLVRSAAMSRLHRLVRTVSRPCWSRDAEIRRVCARLGHGGRRRERQQTLDEDRDDFLFAFLRLDRPPDALLNALERFGVSYKTASGVFWRFRHENHPTGIVSSRPFLCSPRSVSSQKTAYINFTARLSISND
jgi:hypothetical protein